MTLDEAIKHAEEVAKQNEDDAILYLNCKNYKKNLYEIGLAENAEKKCRKCAEEHRQLADWLKELKQYKEYEMGKQALQGFLEGIGAPVNDCVSRITVQEEITKSIELKENPHQLWQRIQALPPVTPAEKVGKWEWVQYDGNPNIGNWHCSECNRIVCGAISAVNPVYSYKYCPNCGVKMQEVSE